MRTLAPASAAILLACFSASSVPAAAPAETQWPGWLGPQRNGRSPDTGLLKEWPQGGPRLLWKTDIVGPGWSSMAVVKSRVYTTGNSGDSQMLFCFDLDGKLKWKVVTAPKCSHGKYSGARSTPVVDNDRIYITSGDGLVTCHAAADGKLIWRREFRDLGGKVGGWLYAESVLILDNLAVVTPGGRTAMVAFDKVTGRDVWRSDVSATAGYSSPIAIAGRGSTLIVNGSQSGIFAVDAKTGRRAWAHNFAENNTANVPTPAYEDGMLFWGVGYGKGSICYKVTQNGNQWSFADAWTNRDLNCHPGNYVVAGGKIYGKGRGLVCVDLKTGKTLWSERVGAGQVAWADGMLYSFADSGGVCSLVEPTATGGKVTGKVQIPGEGASWSHPVIIGGRLYLRYDTNLCCFDVASASSR